MVVMVGVMEGKLLGDMDLVRDSDGSVEGTLLIVGWCVGNRDGISIVAREGETEGFSLCIRAFSWA